MKVLIEAEHFDDLGGWVVDHQSIDVMGSAYLMAHGMGIPVRDAVTHVTLPEKGDYKVWVRTRDWAEPWRGKKGGPLYKKEEAPGRFRLLVDGQSMPEILGANGAEWSWQYAGQICITEHPTEFRLEDLTGFNGRCDAICLSQSADTPPNDREELALFRNRYQLPAKPPLQHFQFDLVVAGGGIAGICTAVSAARRGLNVALIHNTSIPGGNNSSEVRVQLGGKVNMEPYPALGNLVNELAPKTRQNARPASEYEDHLKLDLIANEPNIRLFLNTHLDAVTTDNQHIQSVEAVHILTGARYIFHADLFADCTGDASLGFLAGADFRMGREAQTETGESHAPPIADALTMGTSVMWYSEIQESGPATFPKTPWAVQFTETSYQKARKGDWDWETGLGRDQIEEFERIRDYGLRAIFGNWSYIKHKSALKEEFSQRYLAWVAYVGGKRESRRLMGDLILQEQHIFEQTDFSDKTIVTTWSIDLHYPRITPPFEEEAFRARCEKTKIAPYSIPYRCFYSRNIQNLFMAGRNISVTHVALGTVRVMKTTGMMGEVVGMAAYLCRKNQCSPRDIYTRYLAELKALLHEGVPVNHYHEHVR